MRKRKYCTWHSPGKCSYFKFGECVRGVWCRWMVRESLVNDYPQSAEQAAELKFESILRGKGD